MQTLMSGITPDQRAETIGWLKAVQEKVIQEAKARGPDPTKRSLRGVGTPITWRVNNAITGQGVGGMKSAWFTTFFSWTIFCNTHKAAPCVAFVFSFCVPLVL
ncbi:hypothetical protein [Serratia plymuthica]|uniref:Uncharacterized protein n=1 Tax=Serratia plymuthica TaxID=82996 RepID=A0A7T2SQI5_SERPL|nr:hypothetical protein [Serratia plymuthica]QPS19803.1 hypothetical protein I6G64_19825 [Serratia plymuthica]QPS61515.1 hypothetical protein I6G52_15620 [Serratia plymuthica]